MRSSKNKRRVVSTPKIISILTEFLGEQEIMTSEQFFSHLKEKEMGVGRPRLKKIIQAMEQLEIVKTAKIPGETIVQLIRKN